MKLTVIKSTESRTANQFVTKLQTTSEATINADGLPIPSSQVTYYIMLAAELEIGYEVNLNLENYIVRFQDHYIPEEDKTVILKWLNPIRK